MALWVGGRGSGLRKFPRQDVRTRGLSVRLWKQKGQPQETESICLWPSSAPLPLRHLEEEDVVAVDRDLSELLQVNRTRRPRNTAFCFVIYRPGVSASSSNSRLCCYSAAAMTQIFSSHLLNSGGTAAKPYAKQNNSEASHLQRAVWMLEPGCFKTEKRPREGDVSSFFHAESR